MNSGLLDIGALEKDIEHIIFYTEEEKDVLEKIYTNFNECASKYSSSNMSTFIDTMSNFKSDIESIGAKRIRYTEVLNKVIITYENLSRETLETFEGDIL